MSTDASATEAPVDAPPVIAERPRALHDDAVESILFAGLYLAFRAHGGWLLFGTTTSMSTPALADLISRLRRLPDRLSLQLRKLLKAELLEREKKEWDQTMPAPVVDWARGRLEDLQRGCDCVDNERVACCRVATQVRRYNRQKDNGCCGSVDVKEQCPIDGRDYLIGFNYGH